MSALSQFAGDYFNRKLFHSIQFQAICDHKGRFLDVVVGFPGCVHDARVLRSSPFYVHQLYPPPGWEPVRNAVEGRYNARLSRARCVVERAFGVLKTRWCSIFLKALEVKVEFVPEVITACLFLHNLCIGNGDILEREPVEEEEVMVEMVMEGKATSLFSGLGTLSGTGLQLQCLR
ncbi:hypothetical protein ABVT39_005230 [Epinephelus coioides]